MKSAHGIILYTPRIEATVILCFSREERTVAFARGSDYKYGNCRRLSFARANGV